MGLGEAIGWAKRELDEEGVVKTDLKKMTQIGLLLGLLYMMLAGVAMVGITLITETMSAVFSTMPVVESLTGVIGPSTAFMGILLAGLLGFFRVMIGYLIIGPFLRLAEE